MKTYLITLTLLSTFFFIGCKKDGPIEPPTSAENLQHSQSTSLSKNSYNYLQARNSAATLAKKLAHELNADENLRKEVFSKIAYKFDGDKDILFSHLNNSTLAKLQLHAEVRNAVTNVPKLQIMMPFMEKWTDNSITNYGGLIVAYYPFGTKDKDITQLVGYDKNGNEVIITRETAPTIPYIIVRNNERTDDDGYLNTVGKNGQKLKSIHNINPKDYEVTNDVNWKTKELTKTKKNNLPITNLMPSAEDEDGGGGGGGGGGGTPAPTGPKTRMQLTVGRFHVLTDSWDGWFEGDPEFFIDINGFCGFYRISFNDVTDCNEHLVNRALCTVNIADYAALPPSVRVITLKVMEQDGGGGGSDDFIEDTWRYADLSNSAQTSLTFPGSPVWYYGNTRQCDITAYWLDVY